MVHGSLPVSLTPQLSRSTTGPHILTDVGAGVMANGEEFVWKARRHRKGRSIGGRFVKHPPMPFAWVDPRPFIHGGPMTATRYCSALLLMMGASFFSFSNAVQISPYVRPLPALHCCLAEGDCSV